MALENNDRLTSKVLDAQKDVFRLAKRDHDLCLKEIASKSNIPYNTIRSYAGSGRELTPMPLPVLCKLTDVIPDYLLSKLLQVVGRCLVNVPEDMDFDRISEDCQRFLAEKDRAHHPDSECGRDIGPNEHARLGCTVLEIRGRVNAA